MKTTLLTALVAGALAAGSAEATTTSYTDEMAFALAAGPLASEDFSGATLGTDLTGSVGFGAFTTTVVSALGPSWNVVADPGTNSTGMTGVNLQFGLTEGETLTFTFASAITAFGAIFGNVNDDVGRSAFSGGGTTDWLAVVQGASGRFFGIVSDTGFTTITITGLPNAEGFGVDDVRWATLSRVPVPASGLLLVGAMLAGGLAARRRRS